MKFVKNLNYQKVNKHKNITKYVQITENGEKVYFGL